MQEMRTWLCGAHFNSCCSKILIFFLLSTTILQHISHISFLYKSSEIVYFQLSSIPWVKNNVRIIKLNVTLLIYYHPHATIINAFSPSYQLFNGTMVDIGK